MHRSVCTVTRTFSGAMSVNSKTCAGQMCGKSRTPSACWLGCVERQAIRMRGGPGALSFLGVVVLAMFAPLYLLHRTLAFPWEHIIPDEEHNTQKEERDGESGD